MLALRALAAFLALPAIVAVAVPALLASRWPLQAPNLPLAVSALVLGSAGLLWCVRDFFVSGRGTLAPWDPPRHLVAGGLYRFVRNPMYVSVAAILLGWLLLFPSLELAVYLAAVVTAFHLRVVLHEEKCLARTFGAEWTRYAADVPRWIPRCPRAGIVAALPPEDHRKQRFRQFGHAWLALAAALAIHVADEALTDFLSFYNPAVTAIRERPPWLPLPTFTFGVWISGLATGIALLACLTPAATRGSRVLAVIAIPLSALMVANGFGHLGASLYLGWPVPGVNSSLLLIMASAVLLVRAARLVLASRDRLDRT